MNNIKKLLALFTSSERKRAAMLLVMMLVMALLDVTGVVSILPFMAVLTNPQMVESNRNFAFFYNTLGFTEPQKFLFFLGVMVFLLLVLSLAFKALTTYTQLRFIQMREYSLSKRFIENYLHQPYTWFLNRHSADLGKTILSEVGMVVQGWMSPFMTLLAHSAVAIALLVMLLFVEPILTLTVSTVLGGAYVLIYKLTNGFISRIGLERFIANQMRYNAVSEAFGAAKEVKIGGLEQTYIRRFSEPAEIYAKHQASSAVVAQLPRFAMEAIAFGGMLLLMLYLMSRSEGFASALPTMALYAFAGYRLMPALQQIYGCLSQLRYANRALDALHTDLINLSPFHPLLGITSKMKLEQGILLKDVQFSYPTAAHPALRGISLHIPVNSTIGLVGSTGSGKTTTVDLLLGLLEPQQGSLLVDGQVIDATNRRQWQKAIGYVPQQIYLADDSVAANIAFGVQPSEIDQAAVERAAKISNLHEFVVTEMPQGYATKVGERGVRLSGGQRQRIGIARALYHNPRVLILDEATSALDNLTERAVMDAVNNLGHDITIILIAHRLSTVRQCDQIYLLEKGLIKAHGTYDQLTADNETFRAMATN